MIRVLIVDDSAVLRQQLSYILQSDPSVKVVGQARNGEEALELTKQLHPDVITMDIRMPRMDGLEAVRWIMAEYPVPIVVVTASDVDRELDVSTEALRLGAVSVVIKPGAGAYTSATGGSGAAAYAARLIEQVKLMSEVKVVTRLRTRLSSLPSQPAHSPSQNLPPVPSSTRTEVIAIGSSTGGPAALYKILGGLPANLGVPLLIVQHISFGFVEGLATWLGGGCALPVEVPTHGQKIQPGHIYIAPDDRHMRVDRFGRIRLGNEPPLGGHRPSVTALFQSVAEAYGPAALAAILTGMGADGAVGMRALKDAGARTIAQDANSCVVFGMPKEAIALGAVDYQVPLDNIANTLMALCRA